jgi:hypothetical protein
VQDIELRHIIEKKTILSTELYDRSINKYRFGSNQTHSRG